MSLESVKHTHRQSFRDTCMQKLFSIYRPGKSKRERKHELKSGKSDLIHGRSTFYQYKDIVSRFADFAVEQDPDIRKLKYALKAGLAHDFIQYHIDKGLSPATIKTYAAALAKLFSVTINDIHDNLPTVRALDATRNRHYTMEQFKKDANSPYGNTAIVANFCFATGLRKNELLHLYNNCPETDSDGNLRLYLNENTCYSTNPKTGNRTCETKNGRPRYIIIHKDNEAMVKLLINNTPDGQKVCEKVSTKLLIHGIRALFASNEYYREAADIDSIRNEMIPSQRNKNKLVSRIYVTRDGTGRKFDRLALRKVSKQLGHNRESVVANSYLWALDEIIKYYDKTIK
jgi:hypothetical protein